MGKPAPTFWWKFTGTDYDVTVKSDYPGGEALAVFRAALGQEYRDAQIAEAESLIADFQAGRKTPPWGVRAA